MEYEERRKMWKLLSVLAVILWSCYIWSNSLVPGTQSMQKSQNVVNAVKPVLTSLQIAQRNWQLVVRKSAHFLEFAALGALWLWPLSQRLVRYSGMFGYALLFCVATAFMDELLQLCIGTRSAQLRDVALDSLGAFAGICIGMLILRTGRRILRQREQKP